MIDITNGEHIPDCNTVCALGLFDGVHRGHQLVLNTAEKYRINGLKTAVFTFKTDTVTSKGHDGMLEMILSDEVKDRHFEQMGIDYLFSPDFSGMKNLTCEEFVRDVLVGRLKCKVAVCGADFRFGRSALGDSKRLAELGEKYDIEVVVLDRLQWSGHPISSTEIRENIRCGQMEKANDMLGYTFGFVLPVEHGKAIGRTLDFPTINQIIPKGQVLPRFGVYCTRVILGEKVYHGVTNVGIKPTVHVKTLPLAETFIIGYNGDLYGENVEILFDHFVRAEKKFDNLAELKKQISLDTEIVRNFFN